MHEPIYWGSNFTWAEATHNGTRIPKNVHHTANIIRVARLAQRIRDAIDLPMIVTSWYRPEPWNSWAGGVPNSQHLDGNAMDFYVESIDYVRMYQIADRLVGSDGGVGKYRNNTITHIDARGYRARWYD